MRCGDFVFHKPVAGFGPAARWTVSALKVTTARKRGKDIQVHRGVGFTSAPAAAESESFDLDVNTGCAVSHTDQY